MEALQVIDRKPLRVKLYPDADRINPREDYDHLGTIVYRKGARYLLGDEAWDSGTPPPEDSIHLPVYAYIHGGVTVATTPFHCPWDSGQSGFIFAERKKIREWLQVKRITQDVKRRVYDIFKSEIAEWDAYLQGAVYGYVIEDKKGEVVDSCWGFYDADTLAMEIQEALNCRQPGLDPVKPEDLALYFVL
jgi:hypothetical protein